MAANIAIFICGRGKNAGVGKRADVGIRPYGGDRGLWWFDGSEGRKRSNEINNPSVNLRLTAPLTQGSLSHS